MASHALILNLNFNQDYYIDLKAAKSTMRKLVVSGVLTFFCQGMSGRDMVGRADWRGKCLLSFEV